MFDDTAGCGKRFVAPVNITDKRPFSCVDALVFDDTAGCGKRFVAPVNITDKGLVLARLCLVRSPDVCLWTVRSLDWVKDLLHPS
ncbi:hypothetical protein E1189_02270 [Sansalvadorimonas verongulae]|nr:hypothetical protein [Sansalvadorimonas verongulae]